jgi:hypothetical protein
LEEKAEEDLKEVAEEDGKEEEEKKEESISILLFSGL